MKKLTLFLLLVALKLNAQETPITVITEDIPNRLAFYAINENLQDFDVQIAITGTNFRQSQARPRWIRVPGASKVHLKTIILTRGQKPKYNYDLKVNDSLSKRALKKEFKRIKIKPRKSITIYITDACKSCDSLIMPLMEGNYKYISYKLSENIAVQEQVKRSFPSSFDTITKPIVNLGGRLYTRIESYAQLLDELNKE